MKGQFFESDFTEAQANYEWIKNLTTTLESEQPYEGHWEGPGPAPVLRGPVEEARLRVAVALGLAPVGVLLHSEDDNADPVDRLALRIRERLTGESAADNQERLSKRHGEPAEDDEEESTPPAERKGKLPDGFPGKAALEKAGITTYAQARKRKNLTDISGIGEDTAQKIRAATGVDEPTDSSNTAVDDSQVVDDEGGDKDAFSATETAPLEPNK